MPRRREQNEGLRAERRQQILAAAILLFARQGLDATSMSQVAKEAGVSHGTVFLYFPTKDDLFRAALLEPLAEAEAKFRESLLTPGTPRERIERMVHNQVHRFARADAYVRLTQQVLGHPARFPDLAPELYAFTARYFEILCPIIAEGQRTGELAPGDPRLLAAAFFAYLNGVVLIVDDSPDSPAWDGMAATGMRLFVPVERRPEP